MINLNHARVYFAVNVIRNIQIHHHIQVKVFEQLNYILEWDFHPTTFLMHDIQHNSVREHSVN